MLISGKQVNIRDSLLVECGYIGEPITIDEYEDGTKLCEGILFRLKTSIGNLSGCPLFTLNLPCPYGCIWNKDLMDSI